MPDSLADLPGEDVGAELFRLVARARAAGLEPELELRTAARRYGDHVRAWERSLAETRAEPVERAGRHPKDMADSLQPDIFGRS